ncbi:MAG: cation:proton antiporter [Bacteroidales bacterium]|nr:cation:proton antiporter [Bacteroidales bacterium]
MYGIVDLGSGYSAGNQAASTEIAYNNGGFHGFLMMLGDSLSHPLSILLLQILTILLVARLFSWICTKINQPTVIGEILAGIFLGPSVLAKVLPGVSAFLFAPESLHNITILSQIGLILFMFAIGMELDIVEVKKKLKETVLISHTSTIVPFFFGMLTAYWVYPDYTNGTVPFVSFALFVGIAMSITAFPVLARIIQERGMTKSHLGTLALASAANGDITAWCVLAVVIAIAQAGTVISAMYTVLFTVAYILFMFYVVRPFMNVIGNLYHNKEVINKTFVTFIFIVLILSAFLTEVLGVHALFGAFIAGVVMPANLKFRQIMTDKVEDVSLSLLLPLFFVSTGLRTEIGLLNTVELWTMCGIFILVAIVGKFGGAALSARFVGESWHDSLRMGALMNTRGLMELVVLTIGYEMGILPPAIFVMLVLMTIVTTFMTAPLLGVIDYCFEAGKRIKARMQPPKDTVYKLLLSFGRAGSGAIMLKVAQQLFGYGKRPLEVTALHMTEGTDINPLHIEDIKAISFDPIEEEAENLNMTIQTRYEISNNTTSDIIDIVNNEGFDFLLIGSGVMLSNLPSDQEVVRHKRNFIMERLFGRMKSSESMLFGNFLKDKTQEFVDKAHCSVGVFVNRNFKSISNLLVIMYGIEDSFLLYNIERLVRKDNLAITLIDPNKVIVQHKTMMDSLNRIETTTKRFRFISGQTIDSDLFIRYDFMLIGSYSWQTLVSQGEKMISKIPSSLVVYNYVSPENVSQKTENNENEKINLS